jgi:FkbM family methyltransferase
MDKYTAGIIELLEQKAFPEDAFYAKKVFDGRKVVVYGAGECSHWFMEIIMKMHDYTPLAVLDQKFSRGDTYEGIPAFSPQEYQPTEDEKQDAIVVICVAKQEHHDDIVRCIEHLGFKNIIFLMDVYEIHNPFSLPKELKYRGFDLYREQKDRILAGLRLFSDEESREIYTRCLKTHMQRRPIPLPARPRQEQYFPTDITLRRGYSRFVNCGAYDGDTVRLLHQVCGKVDELICFEADPLIFERLVYYLWKHSDEIARKIVAMPCAVYHRNGLMPFANCGGLGSRISENGDGLVQCVTLDHVLPGFAPSFICMDVEGVEPEVLKGAEKLIRENRPDLAICVYHSPNHLWDIPLYLHKLDPNYNFYLRNYTTFTTETVLYATT